MKTGFIEWGIRDISVPEKVNLISEMGFDFISFHPFFSSLKEQEETKNVINELNLGITFHCANEPLSVLTQKIDSYIETISYFQSHTGSVYCFSFDSSNPESDKEGLNLDIMSAMLEKAITMLSPLKIKVGIENTHLLTQGEHFEALIQKVKRRDFGILLDIGHLNLKSDRQERTIEECIDSLPLEIFELHIHDNDGERDLHRPLGEGNLDLKTIVKLLKQRKFDGVATFEFGIPEVTDKGIETIKKSREIFLQAWDEKKVGNLFWSKYVADEAGLKPEQMINPEKDLKKKGE